MLIHYLLCKHALLGSPKYENQIIRYRTDIILVFLTYYVTRVVYVNSLAVCGMRGKCVVSDVCSPSRQQLPCAPLLVSVARSFLASESIRCSRVYIAASQLTRLDWGSEFIIDLHERWTCTTSNKTSRV